MAHSSVSQPFAEPAVSAGTVRVSVFAEAPPETVWLDLTRSSKLACWFGDASNDLLPGNTVRLDFGDADFFQITDVATSPPSELSYEWRFLGTGPKNRIRWTIRPELGGSLVTVDDAEPLRAAETGNELTEGWTDFLQRLERYVATGKVTRYDWRRTFDGAVEIPTTPQRAAQLLFAADREALWLPFSGGRVKNDARLRLSVEAEPADLIVGDVGRAADSLAFGLRKTSWLAGTHCSLQLSQRGGQTLLTIKHVGWDGINDDPKVCMEQRRLFGNEWMASLHRARELAAEN